jgi:hypothetical protein
MITGFMGILTNRMAFSFNLKGFVRMPSAGQIKLTHNDKMRHLVYDKMWPSGQDERSG